MKYKYITIRFTIAILTVLSTGILASAEDASGPTPFPKDTSLMPGKGVVRVFPWMTDNRNYFWSQRAKSQDAVVFVGDSLTGNWKSLAKAFPKLKIVNRGIGGDVTRGVLFRLKEDVLDIHPKAIVLLIGTNDLSSKEKTSDAIANLTDILAAIDLQNPATPVILCNIPPRESTAAPINNDELLKLNREIAELAKGRPNVTLLDLYGLLVLPDGKLDAQNFNPDKLHLGPVGYDKWSAALTPIFEKLKLQ